ncbi:PREDICTED: zinc finger protein 879-like [Ceratosolen solmsi marchali]|uniref:Zinc finger protein 879-like n=1 Tax=Ceratosolen solmsi marchali TaxID=326594 RepID=A0AAJ6YNB9_9HYME|nr:PREDICTED: zinc finger protein 879-like [Ceratosolen solmsi marchali]
MQFRYLKSFKKHRLNHALERLQRAPSGDSQILTERSDQVSSTGEPTQLDGSSVGEASPLRLDQEERGRDSPPSSEGARDEAGSSEQRGLGHGQEEAAMDEERLEAGEAAAATSTAASLNLSLGRGQAAHHHHHHNHHHHEAERRERRFACPFCGKCVRSKENLKLHVRKHTGERPFVCLFCGRAFGGKSDLTRHLRIHTGERPYHCEMCGKCFARADYLSKHLTTHIHQR